jgi:RNA 3'-terminal phosphate cyclase
MPSAKEAAMLEIDGAHGEGGGQLVRTAVALAPGESCFRVRELSSHARTTMWLLDRFGAATFAVEANGRVVRLRSNP